MTAYNQAVMQVPMPSRIGALRVSDKGFPIPWFVAWIDGKPDFRVVGAGKLHRATKFRLCWVCGEPLGRTFAMTLGPMCVINRTISEPPAHTECAIFSARACPFLANPRARRREAGLPEDRIEAAGLAIKRNPQAAAVWVTRSYSAFKAHNGVLFTFGDPLDVLWFSSGRPATRAEVQESIDTGLPLLALEAEKDGPEAVKHLAKLVGEAAKYLPVEEHACPAPI